MEVSLRGITKYFGAHTVIRKTDLTFPSGGFTTLLGPSGCGKTTLLRMLAGLETPDAGEICFDDRCVFSWDKKINLPPEKRGLGFVFQDFALWPHMTVYENVAFGLRAGRQTQNLDARIREALEAVRLDEYAQRYPHQLSGGQQQRVAFARAIVIRPACILFDEPLSALDAMLREEMRVELKSLVSRLGVTAIFVTHDQTEAMSMSDRIAVLSEGAVEQFGTPEEIYHRPATRFVADFVGRSNWLSGNSMVRPEAVSLVPLPGSSQYRMKVRAAQFLGGCYELLLQNGTVNWTVNSSVRLPLDDEVTIYVDNGSIHQINREGETYL